MGTLSRGEYRILLRYDDWKSLKLRFELHIKLLRKEIKKKLKEE